MREIKGSKARALISSAISLKIYEVYLFFTYSVFFTFSLETQVSIHELAASVTASFDIGVMDCMAYGELLTI